MRSVNDEPVAGDAEDGWNGIEGEHHIGSFHDQKNQGQRRRIPFPFALDPEGAGIIIMHHGKKSLRQPQDAILARIEFLLQGVKQFVSGVKEKGSEDVNQPGKSVQQGGPRNDKRGPQDNRSDNSPGQHPMPQMIRHPKKTENDHEDKKIVHEQRKHDQEAGDKLQGFAWPILRIIRIPQMPEMLNTNKSKGQSQGDPDEGPDGRFFAGNTMAFTLENTQGQRQDEVHKTMKTNTDQPRVPCHHCSITSLVFLSARSVTLSS